MNVIVRDAIDVIEKNGNSVLCKGADIMKKKRIMTSFLVVVYFVLSVFLAGCSQEASKQYSFSEKHNVIIDADVAADDAMAIIMMAKSPNINILGVTTVAGNVDIDQCCNNALMSLEVAGLRSIPVFKGSTTKFNGDTFNPFSVFGKDGMGDSDLIHPSEKPQNKDAVDFIIDTVATYPNDVEIISTGPLTNIAKAIQKSPDIMNKVKHIWSMGSCGIKINGNATPVSEFNVYLDVDAYKYVLNTGLPITIIGFDICCQDGLLVGYDELEQLSKAGVCGNFLSIALKGLVDYDIKQNGASKTQVCDAVTAASLIWSDFIIEKIDCHAEVINDGLAKGAVLFYKKNFNYNFVKISSYNCSVATKVHDKPFLDNVCILIND